MAYNSPSMESAFLAHCGTSPTERRRAVIRVASALPDLLLGARIGPVSGRLDTPEWRIGSLIGPDSNSPGEEGRVRSDLVVVLRPSVSSMHRRGILAVNHGPCSEEGDFIADERTTSYIPDVKTLETLDADAKAVATEPMDLSYLYNTDALVLRLSHFGDNHRLVPDVYQGMLAAIARPAVTDAIRSI